MTVSKHGRFTRFFLAASLSLVLLMLFRAAGPFVYYNNDDLYRKMIVSGEISGAPSPYLIYGHFLLGGLLSGLYRLLPAVPWYGLFSCGCMALAMCAVLYRLLERCRRIPAAAAVVCLFGLFAPFVFYRHLALLQYTVLAGIVGGSALFWALTMDLGQSPEHASIPSATPVSISAGAALQKNRPSLASLAVLCGLALLSYCIRDQVFFMLLPFAGLLWLGRFLCDPGRITVEKGLRYGRPMGLLLLLLLLFTVIQGAAYSSTGWKDFRRIREGTEIMYDYGSGLPDYEENRELYESLDISALSREAMSSRYLLLVNPDASPDHFTALARRTEELDSAPFTVSRAAGLWTESLSSYTDRSLRPVNLLILLLYAGLLALTALKGARRSLIQPFLLFLTRSALWVYILHHGRCPERISWTLLLAELFCLLGLLWALLADDGPRTSAAEARPAPLPGRLLPKRFLPRLLLPALLLCGLALCLRSRGSLAEASRRAKASLAFSANYEELKTYCNSRPNDRFLIDLYATAYYTEDMLSFQTVQNKNALSLGSWLTGSPLTDARLASWGIEEAGTAVLDDPGLYVVFADTADFPPDYFFRYYEEKYPGCAFTLEDTLECSQGVAFLIFKGRR